MGLRIAEIATLGRPVPPQGEGSVEHLVSIITEGLVQRGHEVTLFARADSKTSARLESPVPTGYGSGKWDWQLYEGFQVREAFRRWREFDIIHCHSYHHALLFCDFIRIPVLMSIHIEPGPDYRFLAINSTNRHLHFSSSFQAREFEDIQQKSIIPFGLPVPEKMNGDWGRGDYLAFLGRFHPDKGVLDAIRIARKAGRKLILAAPENDYFREDILPEIDGKSVIYAGELSGHEKYRFLARSAGLLYPNTRGEPFGLVLAEALLSGTPVLARDIGAVSEIVDHGATGWLAKTDEDFLEGIDAAPILSRPLIRDTAVARFSEERMLNDIEGLLTRLAGELRGRG